MLLTADSGIMAVIIFARVLLVAADNGTTVAIVLALITLVGTLVGNFVAWNKIRSDSRQASEEISQEREKSNIEVAQAVMSQTVTTLNERLKAEGEEHEKKLHTLRETHNYEMRLSKHYHDRDVARLERKIERINEDYQQCQQTCRELREEIELLRNGKDPRGRRP
jgi:ABC-type transport system involved in cytochrome bd biosynthesis fused ATPase/permease subunit